MVTVGEHGQMDLRPSQHLIRRHLSLVGTWYTTMQQGQAVQDLVVQRKITPSVLVTDRGGLDDFRALFEKVCEAPGEVAKAVIVNEALSDEGGAVTSPSSIRLVRVGVRHSRNHDRWQRFHARGLCDDVGR